MQPKSQMDAFGAIALVGFALLLAFNQVVIKVTNGGLQPVFFAGLRSLGAIVCIYVWMKYRGLEIDFGKHSFWGVILGVNFAVEFTLLFLALDLTSVSRVSVVFYTMPFWLAIGAWALLGETLTARKLVGMALAIAGVAYALLDGQAGTIWGDLCALGASICWAIVALIAKGTRLREVSPEMQLYWQVVVSAPLLLLVAPLFGDLIRDFQPIHIAALIFQAAIVVSAGFIFWLWLLTVYPAASVASFSFLSPIFSVLLGWLLLGEVIDASILIALLLVVVGLILVNRPARPRA